jgi:hypothetical protein
LPSGRLFGRIFENCRSSPNFLNWFFFTVKVVHSFWHKNCFGQRFGRHFHQRVRSPWSFCWLRRPFDEREAVFDVESDLLSCRIINLQSDPIRVTRFDELSHFGQYIVSFGSFMKIAVEGYLFLF